MKPQEQEQTPIKIPYANNDTALQLMIEYIEKFWCPTISSKELLK